MAITLLAFPAPPAYAKDRAIWQSPRVQEELLAWSGRMQDLGIDTSPAELEEVLFAASCQFLKVRNALAMPFQPYYETGFPHAKNQFISIAASGWATTALALACPPAAKTKD